MSIRKRAVLWAPLALVLMCAVTYAAGEAYDAIRKVRRTDNAVQTWYLTGLTGNHSRTSATPVDLQPVQGGDTFVEIDVRGSDGSGAATACIAVYTAGTDGVLNDVASIQTVTLGLDNLGDGYLAEPVFVFVGGASFYDVRCVARSAGTIDVKANSCGAASFAAE